MFGKAINNWVQGGNDIRFEKVMDIGFERATAGGEASASLRCDWVGKTAALLGSER